MCFVCRILATTQQTHARTSQLTDAGLLDDVVDVSDVADAPVAAVGVDAGGVRGTFGGLRDALVDV